MTTTDMIKLLQSIEKGASGRSREISFYIGELFIASPDIKIKGTGDGIAGAELTLNIESTDKDFTTNNELFESIVSSVSSTKKVTYEISKNLYERLQIVINKLGHSEISIVEGALDQLLAQFELDIKLKEESQSDREFNFKKLDKALEGIDALLNRAEEVLKPKNEKDIREEIAGDTEKFEHYNNNLKDE